jgi:hypothetical protein
MHLYSSISLESTSNGYAKNIVINFHKRTGDQKQEQIENICPTW